MKGFIEFIRTQGVIGLAVAFVLGAALTRVVTALVNDILNPMLAPLMGAVGGLRTAYVQIGSIRLLWGDLLATVIDFLVIALVVYWIVKQLGVDKWDKKKE